jgi:hypothetical protein
VMHWCTGAEDRRLQDTNKGAEYGDRVSLSEKSVGPVFFNLGY